MKDLLREQALNSKTPRFPEEGQLFISFQRKQEY